MNNRLRLFALAFVTLFLFAISSPPPACAQHMKLDKSQSKIQFVCAKTDVNVAHTGTFANMAGTFNPQTGQLAITLDMQSLSTDDAKLTGHLMSPDFFDVRKFPTASFVSTQIRKEQRSGTTHVLVGNLTMHGVTQQLAIPCNIFWQGKTLTTSGQVTLKRSAFGITYGAGQINDDVSLTFHVVCAPDVQMQTVGSGSSNR